MRDSGTRRIRHFCASLRSRIPDLNDALPIATGIASPHSRVSTGNGDEFAIGSRNDDGVLADRVAQASIGADRSARGTPLNLKSGDGKALLNVIPDRRLALKDRCAWR